MTVRELKAELERFDDEMEVKFAYNYGDYWNSEVADDVEEVCVEEVKYSSYHQRDKIIESDREREDNNGEEIREVIVLR